MSKQKYKLLHLQTTSPHIHFHLQQLYQYIVSLQYFSWKHAHLLCFALYNLTLAVAIITFHGNMR